MRPKLLNHSVDKFNAMHVRMDDPGWQTAILRLVYRDLRLPVIVLIIRLLTKFSWLAPNFEEVVRSDCEDDPTKVEFEISKGVLQNKFINTSLTNDNHEWKEIFDNNLINFLLDRSCVRCNCILNLFYQDNPEKAFFASHS